MPQIVQFKAKAQPFSPYMFVDNVVTDVSPMTWWMSQASVLNAELLVLVKTLFTAVASSAGVERLFSTFGFVHSDVRNRLGIEKASKLTFIYRMLNENFEK
jgi:hypothetical protein